MTMADSYQKTQTGCGTAIGAPCPALKKHPFRFGLRPLKGCFFIHFSENCHTADRFRHSVKKEDKNMKNKNKLLDKVLSSKNYNNNLKKYKFSYLNKNEMSLVKVLAAVVFIDNEVDSSELIKVKNILDKLYIPEKSNLLLN